MQLIVNIFFLSVSFLSYVWIFNLSADFGHTLNWISWLACRLSRFGNSRHTCRTSWRKPM